MLTRRVTIITCTLSVQNETINIILPCRWCIAVLLKLSYIIVITGKIPFVIVTFWIIAWPVDTLAERGLGLK